MILSCGRCGVGAWVRPGQISWPLLNAPVPLLNQGSDLFCWNELCHHSTGGFFMPLGTLHRLVDLSQAFARFAIILSRAPASQEKRLADESPAGAVRNQPIAIPSHGLWYGVIMPVTRERSTPDWCKVCMEQGKSAISHNYGCVMVQPCCSLISRTSRILSILNHCFRKHNLNA